MKSRRGFTLIELLVVIAIIGLLASIILASLNTAQQKGRDAKRLADIRDIQNALELYATTCDSSYPNSLDQTGTGNGCPSGVNISTFISPMPTDPSSGLYYLYAAFGSGALCTSYHLGAELETEEVSGADFGPTKNPKCSGGAYNGLGGNNANAEISATDGDFAPGGTQGAWVYDVTP